MLLAHTHAPVCTHTCAGLHTCTHALRCVALRALTQACRLASASASRPPRHCRNCFFLANARCAAQVIRLCEREGLYSALAHISNAMRDFRKPLLDLLAATAGAGSRADAERYCYKLLVYLRCCFRGLAFPPSTGRLPRCGARSWRCCTRLLAAAGCSMLGRVSCMQAMHGRDALALAAAVTASAICSLQLRCCDSLCRAVARLTSSRPPCWAACCFWTEQT